MAQTEYDIIVVGGGHAGAEAAWSAANMGVRVALLTMNPDRIGQMSCNPAIGGLAKGQIVREIDAMGGLMALAADATGIQFRLLNGSKGPAVRGPRCQSDKYAYAEEVQRLLKTRENLTILAGAVDEVLVDEGVCQGVVYTSKGEQCAVSKELRASAVILTTGTFMRGLMHRGDNKTPGGRIDEGPANAISDSLRRLGFKLGRLKTGTPPRLDGTTLDFNVLEQQPGDVCPVPFSDMSQIPFEKSDPEVYSTADRFPRIDQTYCWLTNTTAEIHDLIRLNLDRAPMYNGQIETAGPRYCPSIEDKVVRFSDKERHTVFLEPESHRTNEVYCNGISTSLPDEVQRQIVSLMPGCGNARILRYGYAVEYDMVPAHQIDVTCMTKSVKGFYLAGQINGTTGYEEAAAQGLVAGVNAVLYVRGQTPFRLQRDQAYIGVLMDDLVTKVPLEPYRMFTSRAEHRLLLRSDNAADRLTPVARELGLIDDDRWGMYNARQAAIQSLEAHLRVEPAGDLADREIKLLDYVKRPDVCEKALVERVSLAGHLPPLARDSRVITAVMSRIKYAGFIERNRRQHERLEQMESRVLPTDYDYSSLQGLRNEARCVLTQFRPATFGQASRLAGINPADLTVLAFALDKH